MPDVTEQPKQTPWAIEGKSAENIMTTKELALPTNRAFVVQFRAQKEVTLSHYEGRVEHLVSGQATHFSSWKELQQFIERILTSVDQKPP
jgi:hypothetical protein